MSIRLTCDECSATLTVGSQHAGKLAKCKACGAKIRIPADSDDSDGIPLSRSSPAPEPDQIAPPSVRARSREKKPAVKKRPPARSESEGSYGGRAVLATLFFLALFILRVGLKFWAAEQRRGKQQQAGQVDFGRGSGNAPPASLPASGGGNASASELYSLTDSPIQPPTFDATTFREVPIGGGKAFVQTVLSPGASPGARMAMGVYLPAGDHQPRSLACVLIAPAGTPLIHGNALDGDLNNPEFIPYIRAGYAVVEFSLDGWMPKGDESNAAFATAYRQFSAASAGVKNADAAFRFARSLPLVNPNQIYIAGHSSAATLALLYAAHQPQLAGCIAYAPAVDVESDAQQLLSNPGIEQLMPGIRQFVKRTSPVSHVNRFKVPILSFHSQGDQATSASENRQFCDRLKQAGVDVTYIEVPGNDHYQTMISPGLKRGVDWLAARAGSNGNARSGSTNVAAEAAQGSPSPGSGPPPFRLRPPSMASASDANPPFRPTRPGAAPTPPFGLRSPADGRSPLAANPPEAVEGAPRQQAGDVLLPPPPEPPQTRQVDAESKLEIGKRVLAADGLRWVGAQVVEKLPDERVKVHYLDGGTLDRELPFTHVRLPLPPSEIDKDSLETLRFNLIRTPTGGEKGAEAAAEPALLAVEGYIPKSLEVDVRNKRVTLKVVRSSSAQTQAMLALIRAQLAVTPFIPSRRN
jgi:dienelactone hydrolase